MSRHRALSCKCCANVSPRIMFNSYRLKIWLSWPVIRAHVCTTAVALCFNSTWRIPRESFRYGGVTYALVFTVAMATVALPAALLQLAVGQLSQQDAVGVWRAVPFFRGVGYLRLLISCLASIYTIIYVAVSATHFFYSLSNSIVLWECSDSPIQDRNDSNVFNVSTCLNETMLAPVQEQPEYYVAMSLIIVVLWILFPIILYSPVKFMKRIFYGLSPVVLILAVIILSSIGDKNDIPLFYHNSDWIIFEQSNIWYSAIIQALWSTQIAGGYLFSVGDTIYSCTDVLWTTTILVVVNILAGWSGLMFWYGISGGGEKDTSALAVLVQTYKAAAEKNLSAAWPPLIFALLFFSGVITMVTLVYPVYERFRRLGGHKWRYWSVGASVAGAGAAMSALAVGLHALHLLEDAVLPFLISVTTLLEISAFIFIYGWRVLIEDMEFLVGRDLSRYWVCGWCAVLGIVFSFTLWWVVALLLDPHWVQPPWEASGIVTAGTAALVISLIFAVISVAKQVQYDVIGKLKSSFKPSRHWGPRDPITHYYWLARREDTDRAVPRTRYHRRQLGQFSGNSSFLNISNNTTDSKDNLDDNKRRSNSDDWLFVYRKQCLAEMFKEHKLGTRKRSKSLDWASITKAVVKNRAFQKQSNTDSIIVTIGSIYADQEINNTTNICNDKNSEN